MRDFCLADVEDIKNAPRSLTLDEYMRLSEAEFYMREKRIVTRAICLRLYELIRKAHASYRGKVLSPWKDGEYTRKDGQIWDPSKIPNRAAEFDRLCRDAESAIVQYAARKGSAEQHNSKPADPDFAAKAEVVELSPTALAMRHARLEDPGLAKPVEKKVQALGKKAHTLGGDASKKGGRPISDKQRMGHSERMKQIWQERKKENGNEGQRGQDG